MKSLCLYLCGLFLTLPALATVNKWVDAQGRVHYGDRPPAEKQGQAATLRGTVSVGEGVTPIPAAGRKGSTASEEFATAVAQPRKGEVWIYTTPSCGYCKRAMQHMRQRGIGFIEKDVTTNAGYKSEFRAMGGRGVPLTLSGNLRTNGYSSESFEAFLKSAGF
jgi:glutaredoxin